MGRYVKGEMGRHGWDGRNEKVGIEREEWEGRDGMGIEGWEGRDGMGRKHDLCECTGENE